MAKTKKEIPVYSICTIREAGTGDKGPEELSIYRFGHYLSERGFLFQPHRHSFYHLVYFKSGEGAHSIDFVRFPVRVGQIYFMNPGQVHHWQFSQEKETDGYIINFSKELFHGQVISGSGPEQFPFFSGHCEDQVIQFPGNVQQEVVSLFEKILAEAGNTEGGNGMIFRKDMIRALLWELFILAARESLSLEPARLRKRDPILRQFEMLVDEHYRERKLPKEYAGMLHITPNHLNAICTEALGKPAGVIIRERVILEARRLLINADQSISEIANQLDFPDNSYFTKFFKKYTGNTPEGFRKSHYMAV